MALRPRFESLQDSTPAQSQYPALPISVKVDDTQSLAIADPHLYSAFVQVMHAIKEELLPIESQQELVESMSGTVQRELVYKVAGLDSSVLLSFKTQMMLIEAVLNRVINPDGTLGDQAKSLDISVKEALNLSLKLTTAMSQHLPKIIKVDKVQRLENALFAVVETLPRDKQAEVLKLLEELHERDAKRG